MKASAAWTIMLVGAWTLAMAPAAAAPQNSLTRLHWLSGCWQSDDAERGTVEIWSKPAGGSLLGLSRTVREGQMTAHEYMRIAIDADGVVHYTAEPAGQPATAFRLDHLDDREVVFENPEHDFPQRITYMNEGVRQLIAVLEGATSVGEKRIEVPMTRISCQ
ncbi:MAG: hypothetical protein CMH65_15180 [Nevskiales bacterium]|nr:hypothetical protein [Nevskiales bacterium]